jgi:ATP-dependent Lhr-like helicase
MSVDPFGLLSYPVKRYIRDKKWESFRPIQAAAITRIINTPDHYILSSKTASGKTEAAFLPVISLYKNGPGVQVLYISPLIALVNDQFLRIDDLCRHMDIKITRWHGEANRTQKKKLLDKPEGILLITPESIESLFVNHPYHIPRLFSNLKFIILDEIHSFLGTERGVQLRSLIHRIKENIQKLLQGVQGAPWHGGPIREGFFTEDVFDNFTRTCNLHLSPLAEKSPPGRRRQTAASVRFIGLSATLGDFDEARSFFGEKENTKILRDKSVQEVSARFKYIEAEGKELPPALITDLYNETRNRKSLIFPNTRGRVEEIAVKLKKAAKKKNSNHQYFAHHSSISRELKESAEHFARSNLRDDFSIVCTSTLEMGIDIGTVDLVVQVDSTFSVSSLVNRFGRSGRKPGEKSCLLFYGTNPWSFLQALACFELYNKGFIEPVTAPGYPVDILFHQILSILKETSGINKNKLLKQLRKNDALSSIPSLDVERLIEFMIEKDYIENLDNELILGLAAEKKVNNRSFYSVFRTDPALKVMFQDKCIGELTYSPQLQVNRNVFLGARTWKIIEIHHSKRKLYVKPAKDGQKPLFFGSSGNVHTRVREKILEMLTGGFPGPPAARGALFEKSPWQGRSIIPLAPLQKLFTNFTDSGRQCDFMMDCNKEGWTEINLLRKQFAGFQFKNPKIERPVIITENSIRFFTFTGTKINRTLNILFKSLFNDNYNYDENSSCFDLPVATGELCILPGKLIKMLADFENILKQFVIKDESSFLISKWGELLPIYFKIKMLINNEFDIAGTSRFLGHLSLRT